MALNARSRAILMQKLDRSGTPTGIASSLGTPAVNGPALAAAIQGVTPAVAPLLPGLGGQVSAIVPVPVPTTMVDTIGPPSECLLLMNMFDPTDESEPDFDLDIKEDVQDECSKFGAVKHIFVDKNSTGFIYLRFDNVQSAMSAQRSLHGRWFAGKMITATFMLPLNYDAKFAN